jgi:hypothetical protein
MAIAARNDRPVSYQRWDAIIATPLDFRLDAGRYGLTTRATVWGTAELQRVIADGAGGQIAVSALAPLAGDGYAEINLPAGWYRLALAGITAFTGLIELISREP